VNACEKDIEGHYTDIDLDFIYFVTCNLSSALISNSPIYITKKAQKRKGEGEVAPVISAHTKRPCTVAPSDISLAQNTVSHISLDGKCRAKSLKDGGLKFHVPVRLT